MKTEDKIYRNTDIKRSQYLDIIKGIAIFLVLWGHSIQILSYGKLDYYNNYLFKFIYSFHMPLFMLVSGYLFYFCCNRKTLKELLKNRVIGLIIPIFSWGTIFYLFQNIINYCSKRNSSLSISGYLRSLNGTWFLWSLLIISCIVAVLNRIKKKIIRNIMLTVGIIFVLIAPNPTMNLYMYPYFVIGFLFNEYKSGVLDKLKKIGHLILLIYPIILIFYKNRDYIYTTGINPLVSEYGVVNQIGIDIYRWCVGLFGSVFVLILTYIIIQKFSEKAIVKRISKTFSYLGCISLQIYVMQRVFLELFLSSTFKSMVDGIENNLLATNIVIFNHFITFTVAIIYSLIFYYIEKRLKNHCRLNWILFGR